MPFDNVLQNDFVRNPSSGHGERLLWYRAKKCPCSAMGDSDRALLSCAACNGRGWLYDAPITLTAIFIGVRNEKSLLDAGIIDIGDVMMGMAPNEINFISDFDIIQTTWPAGQPYEGDTIVHTDNTAGIDQLSYVPIRVLDCFTVDPVTGTITNYTNGIDFTVSGRNITWLNGLAPGAVFSIKYSTNFSWVSFTPPADRFDSGRAMGQRVFLRKRHSVFPNSSGL